MQIATLNYQYSPKKNASGDTRAKLRHRQVLATIANPSKSHKQRQSLHSDFSNQTSVPLPPIRSNGKRPSSIRIKGSSVTSSKHGEVPAYPLRHQSRSQSRHSNRTDLSRPRSRSISPGAPTKSLSKSTRLKFGYPIKIRPADFYVPDKSEAELRFREDSFVNDCVRSAHQSRRSSLIPNYEPLDDPHLRNFFQSPVVLDIVRKTLSIDVNASYKQHERSSKTSKSKKNSTTKKSYENLSDDYHRIVSKGSSGYGKLNGYDCIPSYAPARNIHRRSSTVDPSMINSKHWNTIDSRLNHSTTHKNHASANTSVTSFPIENGDALPSSKRKPHRYEKSKQPQPIATSSPLRHPSRHVIEQIPINVALPSTVKAPGNVPEQKTELTAASTLSQD